MSATTQALMEQLEELKNVIAAKQIKGEDVTEHMTKLITLQEKLLQAAYVLNESKQILKG
jgi:hypothetical protein